MPEKISTSTGPSRMTPSPVTVQNREAFINAVTALESSRAPGSAASQPANSGPPKRMPNGAGMRKIEIKNCGTARSSVGALRSAMQRANHMAYRSSGRESS